MTEIYYRDCHLTITIGTRAKMSIFSHMREFLLHEIEACGFDARDPALFRMLTIEERAFRLAEKIVRGVEHYYLVDRTSIYREDAGQTTQALPGLDDAILAEPKGV